MESSLTQPPESPSHATQVHPDELETPPLSLGQLAWRRFRRHKMAIFGSLVLILIIFYAFGGMLIYSEADANFVETGARLQPPLGRTSLRHRYNWA